MGQIMKKVLCSLLAVLMIAGAVPVNAIAFELEKVGESIPAEEEVAVPEVEESLNAPKNGEYETMATPQYTITDTQMEECRCTCRWEKGGRRDRRRERNREMHS